MCKLRLCNRCGEFKSIDCFSYNDRKNSKYKRHCKKCANSKQKVLSNLDSYEVRLYEKVYLETGLFAFDIEKVDHSINQVCLKCGKIKELSEFRFRKGKKDNRYFSHQCKSCEAFYTSEWRKLNPERYEEYIKYYLESGKSYENYINLAHRNLQKFLYYRAKNNAKNKNLEFNLEIEDIVIPEKCPYLEIPLTNNVGKRRKYSENSYSIDRIDPKKGYVKGNVQIISWQANTMKNKASIEELITFSKNALKIHDKNKDEDIV